MVTRINSKLYYQILIDNSNDYETVKLLETLQKYTQELERIVFPPPKDPLVQQWIKDGLIK